MASRHLVFVATSPGLEPLLGEELRELGFEPRVLPGGVELRTEREGIWSLCWQSRLAESVRVRLKPFVARDFGALVTEAARLPWRAYLAPNAKVSVSVTCHKSRLWHSDAVAERVLEVLRERAGADTTSSEPTQRIFVRIERDRVQTSVDAGGERLHRRGYRTHVAEASLRETLAAALVRIAEAAAPTAQILWDPFCGAGTLGLEWLERRLGRLAGGRRGYAFEHWPTHSPALYAEWVSTLEGAQRERPSGAFEFIGSDRAARALDAARANAESAGLTARCRWLQGDFEAVAEQVPRGAFVLTNPPYGVRLDQRDERGSLLRRFGALLARRPDLRPAFVLLPRGARVVVPGGRAFEPVLDTRNGGISVNLLRLG